MKDEKKYYWLKLPQNFFEDLEMKKLRKIAGGDTYTIIYLKLMLISLEENGYIYYEEIEDTFIDELALRLCEDADNVKFTLMYLQKVRLVESNNDEIKMLQVPEMTGKETDAARRMRKSRSRKESIECNIVTPLLQNVTQSKSKSENKSKSIDIDDDKKEELIITTIIDFFNQKFGTNFRKIKKNKDMILAALSMYDEEQLKKIIENEAQRYRNGEYSDGFTPNITWLFGTGLDECVRRLNTPPKNSQNAGRLANDRKYDFDELEKDLIVNG